MKLRAAILALTLSCALAPGLPAQDEAPPPPAEETVELRVSSALGAGRVVVDHGQSDGLELGDRVTFRLRGGNALEGLVRELDERTAVVELIDRNLTIPPGTRGEARIPVTRLEPSEEPPERQPDRLPWENTDEGWTPSMPLLSRIEAVRPEDRPLRISGLMYFSGDYTATSQDDRSDSFLRLGQDTRYENLFGQGGELNLDFELNHRSTELPDEDESTGKFRLDRLSYTLGGTRFRHDRWEAGRFLQFGMPEFGVVDGLEFGQRLDGGDYFGASVGMMPEPDPDMDSGKDFQVAAYYRWAVDERERLTLDGGYQKTWHNGAADRDLFITKVRYVPEDGWDVFGTAWIDYYTSGDDAKGEGVDLTQALVSATRQWKSGNGMNASYRHLEFPEMDRWEFAPVNEDQVADDHDDRLWVSGWRHLRKDRRLHGQVGAWTDEDDNGGDAEAGLELPDLFLMDTRTDFTVFVTGGRFSTVYGGRVSMGKYLDDGRLDFLYEFSQSDQDEFPTDSDILQHRFRASRDLQVNAAWHLNMYAEAYIWENEDSWSAGIYLQRSF